MSMIKVTEKKAIELDNLLKHHLNRALRFDNKVRKSIIDYLENIKINSPEHEDIEIIISELKTY